MAASQQTAEQTIPLQIDAVVKRFGDLTAVDGVSLEVAQRTCLGLLGPNGAGKSTVIRSIAGRVRLDSGSVACSATRPTPPLPVPNSVGCHRKSRFMRCSHAVRIWKPSADTRGCAAGCSMMRSRGVSTGPRSRTVRVLRPRRSPAACGAGSTWQPGLIHRPRLVLLDEPTVGVDPQSRNRIFEMVEDLRNQGTALIYTTHYMEEAERLCDWIAIIDHGQIIAQGTKEELVARSFGGRSTSSCISLRSTANVAAWAAARAETQKTESRTLRSRAAGRDCAACSKRRPLTAWR